MTISLPDSAELQGEAGVSLERLVCEAESLRRHAAQVKRGETLHSDQSETTELHTDRGYLLVKKSDLKLVLFVYLIMSPRFQAVAQEAL